MLGVMQLRHNFALIFCSIQKLELVYRQRIIPVTHTARIGRWLYMHWLIY